MKWKAVLFDLDGTLLDTLADLGDAMNRVLSRHGFAVHDYESYKSFIGNGMANLVRRTLPGDVAGEAAITAFLKELRAEYDSHWADKTVPYPGVGELLAFLQKRQLKLAVLSNKNDEFIKKMVERLLPEAVFAVVAGAKPGVPLKPDPAAALDIAARLELAPADFIYLGDSGVDMETARAAGMYPAGVLWGFRKADELLESGAKILLKHPGELQDFLEKH